MTERVKMIIGGLVSALSGFLGGFDGIIYALAVFISVDYLTGAAAAAMNGELSSRRGFSGILKKICIIALVGIAHMTDCYVCGGGHVFRTAAAMYYIGNEGISLLENCGRMGIPLPKRLMNIMEQLKERGDSDEGDRPFSS